MPAANDSARSRIITWQDPLANLQSAAGMTGLEYMQALASGQLPPPPIAVLMGFEPVEVTSGRVVFACQPGEYHYNPIGVVHGGLISTLLDSAMACAVQTMLPVGVVYTTLELHVNFVRAVTRDTGVIRCEGTVLHAGRRIATAEGRVTGPDGKLYGHGTTTCMVVGPGE